MRYFLIFIFMVKAHAGLLKDIQTFDLSDSNVQRNIALYQYSLAL